MIQLIDKSALIVEIERRIKGLNACHANRVAGYAGEISGLERLLSFLDTLEVKEVKEEPISEDLEEEIHRYYVDWDEHPQYVQTAHHFAKWQKEQMFVKMEQFLYEELSNGDIECRDMNLLIEYLKLYLKGE